MVLQCLVQCVILFTYYYSLFECCFKVSMYVVGVKDTKKEGGQTTGDGRLSEGPSGLHM